MRIIDESSGKQIIFESNRLNIKSMETENNRDISPVDSKNLLYPGLIIDATNDTKTQTSGSSASSSSSESACSINFMPIPKSSSGHSAASSSESSSTTSSSQPTTQSTPKHAFILNAFVNGFVQLKLCADKIDYAYIIEIYWSNETRSFVKRTFDDFVDFHKRFSKTFSEIYSNNDAKLSPTTQKKLNLGLKSTRKAGANDSIKQATKFFNFTTNSVDLLPVLPGQ